MTAPVRLATAPDVLSPRLVAEILGRNYESVRRYITSGELRATKRGGQWFIRREWLEAFIDGDDPAS